VSKKKLNKEAGEDEFEEFVSSAIRAPRQGVYEHLLSQFLASAVVVSDPLKRVKTVTEATMMVPERERKDLAIEYETVDVLNTVCMAFQNHMVQKDHWLERYSPFEIVIIPWGFPKTEENFNKYIAPWYRNSIEYFPPLLREHLKWHKIWICLDCDTRLGMDDEKLPRKCPKCGNEIEKMEYVHGNYYGCISREEYEVLENPLWSWFFEATRCLSVSGFLRMKNEFVQYAIPKVQLFLAELTRLVEPSLYADILGLAKKGSYAEKVEKVAKAPRPSEDELEEL